MSPQFEVQVMAQASLSDMPVEPHVDAKHVYSVVCLVVAIE